MKIALLLVGYGNVAQRFVALLGESRRAIGALGIDPVIVGVVTRRLGGQFDAGGLDAGTLEAFRDGGLETAPVGSTAEWIATHVPRVTTPCVVVETTTLDVATGEPALSHVRAALASGADVITANKGPAAFAARALRTEAAARGRRFFFEGAVMDGIPILSLVRETCPAVSIRGFRGVVNSTTNHILTALEQGESFDTALARMQAAGVAEADPSLDLDGWDAAAKTAVLANEWLDADITPQLVRRVGVDASAALRARDAVARGRRLKLVARAVKNGRSVDAAVELQELAADDPLGILDGQANALEIDTWPLGRIVITQRDGGMEKTAQALVSDLVAVVRDLRERDLVRTAHEERVP